MSVATSTTEGEIDQATIERLRDEFHLAIDTGTADGPSRAQDAFTSAVAESIVDKMRAGKWKKFLRRLGQDEQHQE